MPQHRIRELTIVLDDGSTHTFAGEGSLTIIRTLGSEREAVGRVEATMPVPAVMNRGAIVTPSVKGSLGPKAMLVLDEH